MTIFKRLLLTNLFCSLLLISPFGTSATTKQVGSLSVQRALSSTLDGIHYVTAELLSINQHTLVTSRGTYTVTYIPVLDQRITGVSSSAKSSIETLGKVKLKLDKQNQLQEAVLY